MGMPYVMYVPAYKHTAMSDVNISRLPKSVKATRLGSGGLETYDFAVKDTAGKLLADAIPAVAILKEGGYFADTSATIRPRSRTWRC